jgi:hypothetical protein
MKWILSKSGVRLCTGFKRLGVGFPGGFCEEAMNPSFPMKGLKFLDHGY